MKKRETNAVAPNAAKGEAGRAVVAEAEEEAGKANRRIPQAPITTRAGLISIFS